MRVSNVCVLLQNKRRKLNNQEKPENYTFFCDRCDRGFKTEEKYNEHTAQHEKVPLVLCVCVCMVKFIV